MKEPFLKTIKTGLPERFLLIACGLPATGKTTACREISKTRDVSLLSTDLIRRKVLKNEDIFDEKIAADMEKRQRVYDAMFRQADEALKKNDRVILDATFVTQALRRRAAAIAAGHKIPFVIVQTVCPREVAVRRLLKRTRDSSTSNALTEQAYLENEKQFEPVNTGDLKKSHPYLDIIHLVIDTTSDETSDWHISD